MYSYKFSCNNALSHLCKYIQVNILNLLFISLALDTCTIQLPFLFFSFFNIMYDTESMMQITGFVLLNLTCQQVPSTAASVVWVEELEDSDEVFEQNNQ